MKRIISFFYELRFLSPGANIRLCNNEKIRNYHSITSCTEWINICLKLNLMINRISIYRLWFIWVILWSNICILGGIQLYFNVKIISFLTFSAVENFMILITKGWNSCITSTPLRNSIYMYIWYNGKSPNLNLWKIAGYDKKGL